MGRRQRDFPRGKFMLRVPRETTKRQEYAIYLYYYWHGRQLRRSTDIFVAEKDWNEKANNGLGELRSSYGRDYRDKNIYLNRLLQATDDKIFKYVEAHGRITADVVHNIINGNDEVLRPDKGVEFVDFAKDRITQRYDNGQIGVSTYKNGLTYINQFQKYLKYTHSGTHGEYNELLYVGEMTVDIVSGFRKWYSETKKTDTVNKVLQCIAGICTYAVKCGLMEPNVPIEICDLHISDRNVDARELNVKYLTDDELQKYANSRNCLQHPRQKDFHDMFMFSFYTCGLRLIDIITLRWSDIDCKKKLIRKVQIKTGNRNFVPFLEPAERILERWKGRNKVYVFDLLAEEFDLADEEGLQRRRNCIDVTVNTSLKKQIRDAKVDKSLTFHMARHTWAVLALQKGINISKISALLGHKTTAVTEKVYAEFLPDDLKEVVSDLNFDFG